jgi:HD-GYP domain-containing protein (c-di-GMP phosphodiesterase class II)
MRTHVDHGVDILKSYRWFDDAVDVVRYQHEKFDGSGYMGRLSGEEIPLNARIFTIVDVFDALTSERPYKKALEFEETVALLDEESGTSFDPYLLENFLLISKDLFDKYSRADSSVLEEELNKLLKSVY